MKVVENKRFAVFIWLLPLLFGLFAFAKFHFGGPHWFLQNGDFNYVYLLSGLDYLHLQPSGIHDQPAFTVKIWNALIIGVVFLFRRLTGYASELDTDVFTHSEMYLNCISLSLFVLVVLALFFYARYTFKVIENKSVWLIALLPILFSSGTYLHTFVNKPEPYLIIAGLWLGKLIIQHVFTDSNASLIEIVACIAFGVLSKITIAPFYLVLFFLPLAPRMKIKLVGVGILLITIAFIVAPESVLILLAWVFDLLITGEAYGQGHSLFFNTDSLPGHLLKLVKAHPLMLASLAAVIVALFKYKETLLNRKAVWLFVILFVLVILLFLKLPSIHYFIPLYALLGSLIAISFGHLDTFKWRNAVLVAAVLFCCVRAVSVYHTVWSYSSFWLRSEAPKNDVQTYYANSKSYALFLANTIQFKRHSDRLFEMYPNDQFYHVGQFWSHAKRISYQELVGLTFTVIGTSDDIESNPVIEILDKKVNGKNIWYVVKVVRVPEYR